jgi:hypothetical protein
MLNDLEPTRSLTQVQIYRISDIVRAAKTVVIAISNTQRTNDSVELLKQFGSRVWTLPEILLAPQRDNLFRVYSDKGVMKFTRYQILRDVWTDADTSRQLVEHFEGSLRLSRLELSTIALRTFYNRDRGPKFNGDREYALMGLLRQRVLVNPDHTPFEAFASLSLMADSDRLLERLICIQPKTRGQEWDDMEDSYGAKLWDIYPSCQISGIGHGRRYQGQNRDDTKGVDQLRHTVIIDGLRGAQVRWKSFQRVSFKHRRSLIRELVRITMDWSAYLSLFGLVFIIIGASYASAQPEYVDGFQVSQGGLTPYAASLLIPGILFFVIGAVFIFFTPEFLITRVGGKKWGNQPWLFGIEGYCPIGEIESKLFGTNEGHLKWDPFGSPLSRHAPNEYGEVQGEDPMGRPDVHEYVRRVRERGETRVSFFSLSLSLSRHHADHGQIFMLVDTHVMKVTLFEAARPPIAFLLAGSEGGMQRAIGVSMDWTTNTLYRECVLRMDSRVQGAMPRVSRVRLGLRRDD